MRDASTLLLFLFLPKNILHCLNEWITQVICGGKN